MISVVNFDVELFFFLIKNLLQESEICELLTLGI